MKKNFFEIMKKNFFKNLTWNNNPKTPKPHKYEKRKIFLLQT